MRKLLLTIIIGFMILPGCDKLGGVKSKYSRLASDMEKMVSDLQNMERNMDDMIMKGKKPEGGCVAAIDLAKLRETDKNIRSALDAVMPKDMPFSKITEQESLDPITGQPVLETTKVVDIGKLTGTEQNLWYNLHSAQLSLSSAVSILAVACQCVDNNDKESIQCTMTAAQLENSRFTLGLNGVQSYLNSAKELIGKM